MRANRSALPSIVWPLRPALLLIGALSCGRPSTLHELLPVGESRVLGLSEGWNLVSTLHTDNLLPLENLAPERWAAWRVEQHHDELHRVVVRYHQASRMSDDGVYWVYVEAPGKTIDPSSVELPTPKTQNTDGWQFFVPSEEIAPATLQAASILEWDVQTQALVRIAGPVLHAGHTYVARFGQACRPGPGLYKNRQAIIEECGSVAGAPNPIARETEVHVFTESDHANYVQAQQLRDRLFVEGIQREYEADPTDPDSQFLADHGRVWAYGQGLALAQYSRAGDERAVTLSRFVCDSAATWTDKDGETVFGGWHFSWNTDEDVWKDARLVTGANAWVVHGLGAYLLSDLFKDLSQAEKNRIDQCYWRALYGLMVHFDGSLDLVTAGWTTQGLKNAGNIDLILPVQPDERSWAYYDILDTVGYNDYFADNPPSVDILEWDRNGRSRVVKSRMVTPSEFVVLGQRAKASNVVTEHNLDVLAVINQLVKHWNEIPTPSLADLRPSAQTHGIDQWVAFRDRITHAIFTTLWNDEAGRVITGGEIVKGHFLRSTHTAIDNCTWLAISVDYPSLSAHQVEKLGRCLDYTLQHFVKDLHFEGKVYRGAHYFQQGFEDRYIAKNSDQDKLYHLEATTGLILALLYFAEAQPRHDGRAVRFEATANRLWRDMRSFVIDHDFPYSTHRIQDLTAKLQSATSAIWFIDVYNHYQARAIDDDAENLVGRGAKSEATVARFFQYPLQFALKNPEVRQAFLFLGIPLASQAAILTHVNFILGEITYVSRNQSFFEPPERHWRRVTIENTEGLPPDVFATTVLLGEAIRVGLAGLQLSDAIVRETDLGVRIYTRHAPDRWGEAFLDLFGHANLPQVQPGFGITFGPREPSHDGLYNKHPAVTVGKYQDGRVPYTAEEFDHPDIHSHIFCSHNPALFTIDPRDPQTFVRWVESVGHIVFYPEDLTASSARFDGTTLAEERGYFLVGARNMTPLLHEATAMRFADGGKIQKIPGGQFKSAVIPRKKLFCVSFSNNQAPNVLADLIHRRYYHGINYPSMTQFSRVFTIDPQSSVPLIASSFKDGLLVYHADPPERSNSDAIDELNDIDAFLTVEADGDALDAPDDFYWIPSGKLNFNKKHPDTGYELRVDLAKEKSARGKSFYEFIKNAEQKGYKLFLTVQASYDRTKKNPDGLFTFSGRQQAVLVSERKEIKHETDYDFGN